MKTYRAEVDPWWAEKPMKEGYTVYEPERSPRKTGLLDQHGNPIYTVETMDPIGFVTFG